MRTLLKHYSWIPSYKKSAPGLTIIFAAKSQHGGLMDRVKGIISAAQIAESCELPLRIYEENDAVGILNFLKLKNDDFLLKNTNGFFNTWTSKLVLLNDKVKYPKEELLRLFRKKLNYHLFCNLDFSGVLFGQANAQKSWHDWFHKLFYFDEGLVLKAQSILGQQETCGIHLRFTSILGDFDDTTKVSLAAEDREALIKSCADEVFNLIQLHPWKQFMVVSDSTTFLDHIKKNQHLAGTKKLIWADGTIGHVDYNKNAKVIEKTILDFYLLTRCSKIIQVKESRMYNSQYSQYAAMVSGMPYELHKI